jgi:hypothetical protein
MLAGLALPAVAILFGWALGLCRGGAARSARRRRGAGRGRDGGSVCDGPDRPHGLSCVHALGVAAVLASAAGVGFVSFLVTNAVESGMSEVAAGVLLVAVSLAATTSRIAMGVVVDRAGQEPLRPVATMLAASVAGYLLLIAAEPGLIAAAALVVRRSPRAPGWAVGVMMTGVFVGAVTGPLLTGFLAEHDLFAAAWIACAAWPCWLPPPSWRHCAARLGDRPVERPADRGEASSGRSWIALAVVPGGSGRFPGDACFNG